jgi:Ca-activated chloride channel family protein
MSVRDDGEQLTAYALGEAEVEQMWAVDAELARDPHARAELEAIRNMAALLEHELTRPTGLALSAQQRAAIAWPPSPVEAGASQAAGRHEAARHEKQAREWRVIGGALAAAMLAACFIWLGLRDGSRSAIEEEMIQLEFAAPVDGVEEGPARVVRARAKRTAPEALADRVVRARRTTDALAVPRGEHFEQHEENPFVPVADDPRSTFSIDVDTASYALVRRFLRSGQLPPEGAVRIEELVNYFTYAYPEPTPEHPFSLTAEVADAPWARDHKLLRIGLKARHVARAQRTASNLVFLIDVSGSMADANKLPMLKQGLHMLVRELDARDRISIVVYAGASGLVLPATRGDRKDAIAAAIDRLEAGGSTNGGEGIRLAYATAARGFVKGGVNRVLLATDGDFNVGVTDRNELTELIQEQARTGVFLSVLGFGSGNYKDAMLEQLADQGNGNYAYVDGLDEARKVLVEQAEGTLITVAKDVKLQLELNPGEVSAFRLLGYENRVLGHRDFHDDRKDAGEIGAGHTVTAFYELVPAGRSVDALKYQKPAEPPSEAAHPGELLTIKLRYKLPESSASRLLELAVQDSSAGVQDATADFRFGAAVAAFGMLLRDSPHRGDATYDQVLKLAQSMSGREPDRQAREEFLELVRAARALEADAPPR